LIINKCEMCGNTGSWLLYKWVSFMTDTVLSICPKCAKREGIKDEEHKIKQ